MPSADIEAVKAAHPILEVIQDLGLTAVNNRFRCPRPENHTHGDRSPSVTVWPERGSFKCWVCPDVRGDVIDLIRLVKGCSFREALDFLGHKPEAIARPRRKVPAPSRPPAIASAPAGIYSQGDAFPSAPPSTPMALEPSLFPEPAPPDSAAIPHHIGGPRSDGRRFDGRRFDGEDEDLRQRILAALLEICPPVGGKYARYLQKRRIFKRTWDAQGIRMIDDYGATGTRLAAAFGAETLVKAGFFNPAGHLRYYRHRLLFPYFDQARKPVYMQARAIEPEAKPKELSLSGPIPLPYNLPALDGLPGHLYLCEGVIDTLTLLEQGFPAVGVPGAANFKPAWAPLFRNKRVHVAFDPDAPGNSGAARAIDLLKAEGVEANRLMPPEGKDLNDWFRRG